MRALNRFALSSAVVFVGVVVASTSSSCAQRPVPCTVGRSLPYAAKYKAIATEGTCDGVPAASLAGDQLGMSAYNPTKAGGLPDTSQVDIAIRTLFLGAQTAAAFDRGVVDEDDNHAASAIGSFTSDVPDDAGLCSAPTLTSTAQVLPALPEDTEAELPAQDAVNVQETWSDVSVYVSASALGTQMKGSYSVTQDGCTATYHVLAMYPATDCTGEDGGPDQSICDDPASGISPDFAVVCDPALLLCVLDADVDADLPVLKK
jgi:hypothetical protein